MVRPMQIQVNGESRSVGAGGTVADLLRQLEVRPDRVAVEINLEILDRQEFDQRALCEGDQIEIISFVGGGTQELDHRVIGSFQRNHAMNQSMNQFLRGCQPCKMID